MPVEPVKFRILGEVADRAEVGLIVGVAQYPAHVRPPEPVARRRVDVVLRVGKAMVSAVVSRPPQDALLRRRHRQKREDELEGAAGLKRPVGKVTVVAGGDEKHPRVIHRRAEDHVRPAKLDEKSRQAGQVHGGERQSPPS